MFVETDVGKLTYFLNKKSKLSKTGISNLNKITMFYFYNVFFFVKNLADDFKFLSFLSFSI